MTSSNRSNAAHRALRRVIAAALTLLAAVAGLTIAATPAHAEDGYQFWAYYLWNADTSTWDFATAGPADIPVTDGTVQGYRFAAHPNSQSLFPRTDGDFDAICGDAAPADDQVRVAFVIDYGTPVDGIDEPAPEARGECAVVADGTSSLLALEMVAERRDDAGLTCALDGYPASGCGDAVTGIEPPPEEEPVDLVLSESSSVEQTDGASDEGADDEGFGWTLVALIGIAAVIGLAALAGFMVKRRA